MENLFAPLLWLAAVIAASAGGAVWWWRCQAQADRARDIRAEADLDLELPTAGLAPRRSSTAVVWQDTQPAARPSVVVEPEPVRRAPMRPAAIRPFAQTGSPGL
jgi:hypothetical protein